MAWVDKVWQVVNGPARVARRKAATVDRIVGEKPFCEAARKQGFHVAKVGDQYFVFKDKIDVKC